MAMSNCRECGKAVSTKAKTCPNCGAPKPAKKLKIKRKVRKKFSMAKDITPHISNAPPRSKNFKSQGKDEGKYGKIYVHCPDKSCNKFSEVNLIPHTALGNRVCTCGKKLIPYDYEGGRPVMPRGHLYRPNPSYEPPSSQSSSSSSSSSNSQSENNTFDKFMNGNLDLATSFWGFLIVGSLIVGFVCGWLSEVYGKGWVIPLAIYTYLAVGGTWQAAEKYKIEQNKKKQTLVWGFLAQVICVLNAISVIGMFYESFIK
tara:strand:- start:42 stop:815 length:774 start_codon:yes stop_codon:yes gene_type:complete